MIRLFLLCLVAALVLFPIIGQWLATPVATEDDAAWCEAFEKRDEFSREEAGRYLDYCPHFDMDTQTEVPGRKVQ